MLIVLGLLLQVAAPSRDSGLVHRNGRVPRAVTAVRTDTPPAIDGRLDDPIWARIAPEKGFRRDVPSDGNPGTQETEVRIAYDHRFAPAGNNSTTMTWVVVLRGPLAWLIRPIFARIYGRNLDRAIPGLQAWIRPRTA